MESSTQNMISFYSCMKLVYSFQPKFRLINIYTHLYAQTCHSDKIKSMYSRSKQFLKLQKNQAEIGCVTTSWTSHLIIYSGKIGYVSITVMKKNGMHATI